MPEDPATNSTTNPACLQSPPGPLLRTLSRTFIPHHRPPFSHIQQFHPLRRWIHFHTNVRLLLGLVQWQLHGVANANAKAAAGPLHPATTPATASTATLPSTYSTNFLWPLPTGSGAFLRTHGSPSPSLHTSGPTGFLSRPSTFTSLDILDRQIFLLRAQDGPSTTILIPRGQRWKLILRR